MKLDSVSRLETALGIYRKLGFKKTAPYCHNPLEGAIFLAKPLTQARAARRTRNA
jgi:hypothetical protein